MRLRHLLGTKKTLVQVVIDVSVGKVWRPLRDLNSCLLREREYQAFSALFEGSLKSLKNLDFHSDIGRLSLKSGSYQSAAISIKFRQWAPIGHQTGWAYRLRNSLDKSYIDTHFLTTRTQQEAGWGHSTYRY